MGYSDSHRVSLASPIRRAQGPAPDSLGPQGDGLRRAASFHRVAGPWQCYAEEVQSLAVGGGVL